ncbi:helix-turn-helix domain-containing protein [Streptomyces cyaneofuscatus]|uniref:helix-turn-helix domain-containing protein n=1 Tax=Streptomyces cyaneofuscatus TaxID=66883 RepID=UPI003CF99728
MTMMTENRWFSGLLHNEGPSFNPARLTSARERRGLSKQALAELCGVSRRTVTAWEAGSVDAPPVEQVARVLELPASFFLSDDPPQVKEEWVSFRALSSMTARQVRRVLAVSSMAIELSGWIDKHYGTPIADLPDVAEPSDIPPAIVAEQLRSTWGLHQKPIRSMLALLERRGVRVFSLPAADREIDAFSFNYEGRPFVFLNTSKTAERTRFDLAHELGHLVLHDAAKMNLSRQVEQEAHDFAASFLIPADGLYAQVVGKLRFDDVFKLKTYWKVSALAMVERLYRLDFISEWNRRQWLIELSERGYRTAEPEGMQPESSKFLTDLFKLAREDEWTSRTIADHLKESEQDLDALVFGLAMSAVPGGGQRTPSVTGHLRVVK